MLVLPVAVVAVGLVVVGVRAGSDDDTTSAGPRPTPTGTQATTPAGLLADAFDAAQSAGSVHIEVTHHVGGRTVRYVNDDGARSGTQRITVTPDLRTDIRVVGTTTYVRANLGALTRYVGLPLAPSAVAAAADRWIALKPHDPRYIETTAGVTLESALGQFHLTGPLTSLARRTVDGVAVVGVRGTAASMLTSTGSPPRATLWVRAEGDPMPVAYIANLGGGATFRASFTAWGTPVHATAPAHSTTLDALSAGSAA